MMRKLLATLAVLVAVLLTTDATVNVSYYGPGACVILYPTSTVSSTHYTAVGAATLHEAIDDSLLAYDDDATYMFHDRDNVASEAIFELSDSALYAAPMHINYVTVGARIKRGTTGSGTSGPSSTASLVIGGADYAIAATYSTSPSYSSILGADATRRKLTDPATTATWTAAAIDAMRLKIATPGATTRPVHITQLYVAVCYETPRIYGTLRERTAGGS